jgi:hypothetical protein
MKRHSAQESVRHRPLAPALALLLGAGLLEVAACLSGSAPSTEDLPVLESAQVDVRVLSGTPVLLTGRGFPARGAPLPVRFTGTIAGTSTEIQRTIELQATATTLGPRQASLILDDGMLSTLSAGSPGAGRTFQGRITLTGGPGQAGVSFATFTNLEPRLDAPGLVGLALGGQLQLTGEGFIGAGEEGQTNVRLAGTFTPSGDALAGMPVDVQVEATFIDRAHVTLPVSPGLLGVVPGTFLGRLEVQNRNRTGQTSQATSVDAQQLVLSPPAITAVAPMAASLGQRIVITGDGFVDQATLVRLSGTFRADPGPEDSDPPTVPITLTLAPNVLDRQTLDYVLDGLAVDDDPSMPTGLGRVPGTFQGTITPVISANGSEVVGDPLVCGEASQCTFRIEPILQVVHVKYLDSFIDGLRRFGLRNLEAQVKARALEVASAMYRDFNVEFREEQPTDYALYTTVEVGGPDPNRNCDFGLDNTPGIDTGNQRLDDYVGSSNGVTGDVGGVFIETFFVLSNRLPLPPGCDPTPIATRFFDATFEPFLVELGGTPASLQELSGGARAGAIRHAVYVLGGLIGDTLAHEFGHTLGLSVEPQEELCPPGATCDPYHNLPVLDPSSGTFVGEPHELMNRGVYRSFEDRAQVRGGYEAFNQLHRDYLQSILPRPQAR